jgi:outer membrane murein-binding lipoprotein Lpp
MFALFCASLWTLAWCGCSARGELDTLEAELRRQEGVQEQLQSELAQARSELQVSRSDATALREQLSKNHRVSLTPEQADVLYRATAIKFSPLLTSGQSRDGQPGDEGLSVMLVPVDEHGDVVKLAGTVELELFDMSQSGEDQRLGLWQFTAEEVRQHWRRGLVGPGYLFEVDWQSAPVSPELTLHARFLLPDGRKFNATTQVRVEPPPGVRLTVHGADRETPEVTSDRWDVDSIPTLR